MILLLAVLSVPVEPTWIQLAAVRIDAAHIRRCHSWSCSEAYAGRALRAASALRHRLRNVPAKTVLARSLETASAVARRDRAHAAAKAAHLIRACDAIDGGEGRLRP